MFQALLHCSYIVKHDPSYPSITMWSLCVAQARYLYYPSTRICFGISANPNFYLPTWLIPGNISWMTFLGCRYHHTGTCRNWQCSENDLQHDVIQRVGHGHPQYRLMLLPTTPLLHASKFVNLIYSFILSPLQVLSRLPVISLLHQLSFAGGKDSYFGLVGRYSIEL